MHDVGCGLRGPRATTLPRQHQRTVAAEQVFTIEPASERFINALLAPFAPRSIDWKLVERLSPFGGIASKTNVVSMTRVSQPHPRVLPTAAE